MTIQEWLRLAKKTLEDSGCPDPEVDARWIAEDGLGMTRTELLFDGDTPLKLEEEKKLGEMLGRRAQGEPVQYVLGSACFMGLKFYVDNRVLIPRQDTETLVEALVVALTDYERPDVLDLCTGSGAIGLSVKTLVPKANVTLTDISREALEVTKRNGKDLNAEVSYKAGDLFKAVGKETFDVIASNPPYIPCADLANLQREVKREPMLALDGGEDGLNCYRRIAAEVPAHLRPRGQVFLEVGIGQAETVERLLKDALPSARTGILNDLNGIGRVVWAKLPE